MSILSNLSERLKELMAEAEINAKQLAAQTRMDASVIARLRRAERMPSAATLVILADFFHCSADYLIGRKDMPEERTYLQRPPFSEQLSFLLAHFGVTKYKLEKDTGLTEETVNRWHRGRYEPSVESLVRLADYFGCSVDFILGRES